MPDLVNPGLIELARQHLAGTPIIKESFIPATPAGGDPSGGAAGGAGGDPSGGAGGAAGGSAMPPGMPGGDPSGGGGAPPSFPAPDSGGGGDANGAALQQILQLLQSGGGAGGEPIKPKIDVNVELMQIKNLLAKLCDAAGIQVPATDMVATSDKLTQMGMQSAAGGATGGGGGGGAGPQSAIAPMQPMQGAAPGMGKTSGVRPTSRFINNGQPFDGSKAMNLESMPGVSDSAGLHKTSSMAGALLQIRNRTGK